MKKAVKNNFHWFLLGAIPFLFIIEFFNPLDGFDIQLHDTYFVFGRYVLAGIFSIGLALKALLYYLTRDYPYSKVLCYLDVFLSILVCCSIYYINYIPIDPASTRSFDSFTSRRLHVTLLIIFWVLIQLFVFINFFVHLLIRTYRTE